MGSLLVGISYDKDSTDKKHSYVIESMRVECIDRKSAVVSVAEARQAATEIAAQAAIAEGK